MKTNNSIVDAIGQMNFGGNVNVIPQNWYRHLTLETEKGTIKPDLLAIIILSEIVYWYRPTVVRDEETGRTIGYKKKFRADLLQRSIDSFADQFGITKRQSKDALFRLESEYKVIHRHYKNIHVNGKPKNNVLFIELFPDKLKEITFEEPKVYPKAANPPSEIPCDENPSYGEKRSYGENSSDPMTKNRQTNTSITCTETTCLEEEEERPAPKFHLFEEYKALTGKTPNAIQSQHFIKWVATFPPEVLQEGLRRLQERAPDNPFSYLRSIMEDWQAKKLLTLEAIMQQDAKKQQSGQKQNVPKNDTGETGTMINGHFVDF